MDKWHALSTGGGLTQRLLQGVAIPQRGGETAKTPTASEAASALGIENASGLAIARTLATPLLGPLTTAGVVLLFTIFILLSNEDLRDRLVRLVGRQDLHRTILAMNDAAKRLSRYFLFQLGLNSSFGTLIALCLWWAGLPNPILWGILAALMRFVPFIGIFIALVPPLLLAVAVVPGWTLAIIVFALFLGTEMVMGQVVEPLIYGHSTGLSPIAVIVATAFWAFLWGPVGLLLATPLTVCLVVIGRHVQPLAFLDVILGDTPPLEPPETFYQRALEGHASDLAPAARAQIAATSRSDYYDKVALRGLALAQRDLARDALAFERLEEIHVQITKLLKELEGVDRPSEPVRTTLPHDWQASGAVVCIPGRGQLDDLAATMAAQVLKSASFGATVEPNLVLGSTDPANVDLSIARLCCLSVLEDGSTASGIRYFVRRMRKKMPDANVVVCLWQAPADSALLAELRSTGEEEHLVLSIGELMALAQALSARRATVLQPGSVP
jgi:predicted PurR-regulated permease PerM